MKIRSCIALGVAAFFVSAFTLSFADEAKRLTLGGGTTRAQHTLVTPKYLAAHDYFEASHTFVDPMRVQQVYSSAEFGDESILITGIYWRPCADPQYGFPFHVVLPGFQVNLSTTSKQPDELSMDFAENSGPDETVVFNGRLAISSRFEDSVGNTKKFDIFVPFKHPFFYDPRKGNLLLDTRCFQNSRACYVGEYGAYGDAGSRVYATNPDATTAEVMDTGADVIELVFTHVTRAPSPRFVQLTR